MLLQINRIPEKMPPFITPTGVTLGIIFSAYIKDYSFIVPWLFAIMTFEGRSISIFIWKFSRQTLSTKRKKTAAYSYGNIISRVTRNQTRYLAQNENKR